MTSNNSARVLKRDVGNTKGARLDMDFFIMNNRGTKKLNIKDIGYNVGEQQ
jgi:hypothetical protein